jgi:hypothetical protein
VFDHSLLHGQRNLRLGASRSLHGQRVFSHSRHCLQPHIIPGDVSSNSSRPAPLRGSTHKLFAPRNHCIHSYCSSQRRGKLPIYLRRTFRVSSNMDIRTCPAGLCPLIQAVLVPGNDEGPWTQSPESLIAGIHDEGSAVARPLDTMCRTRLPSLALVCKALSICPSSLTDVIVEVDLARIQSSVATVALLAYFKRGHQPCQCGHNSQLAPGMRNDE